MAYQTGVSGAALAVANPWSMVPPLGNLDAYISASNRLPMLTLEQEQEFSRQFRQDTDLEAAGKQVLSMSIANEAAKPYRVTELLFKPGPVDVSPWHELATPLDAVAGNVAFLAAVGVDCT